MKKTKLLMVLGIVGTGFLFAQVIPTGTYGSPSYQVSLRSAESVGDGASPSYSMATKTPAGATLSAYVPQAQPITQDIPINQLSAEGLAEGSGGGGGCLLTDSDVSLLLLDEIK